MSELSVVLSCIEGCRTVGDLIEELKEVHSCGLISDRQWLEIDQYSLNPSMPLVVIYYGGEPRSIPLTIDRRSATHGRFEYENGQYAIHGANPLTYSLIAHVWGAA